MNNKIEQQNQKLFEQQIELLITYKKMNPKEKVYISEKSLNKAIEWYRKIEHNIS